jgi:glycosyltransferase involved in cell wall biosynthesis
MRTLRFFLRERPNIVHAHNSTSLHYAAIGKVVSRAPLVVTIHGETHWRLGSALEWWLATSVIAVSGAAMRTFRFPCAADKFTVIHNGIAPVAEGTNRERSRSSLDVGDMFVGAMVARIDGRKGHATLLKSLRILRDENVRLLLLVVGDGSLRSELERQAKELSLDSDSVRFLGSRSDVNVILSAADFFVLPSDTEGLPLSVLEAMAHGLPVVASRVGGIPELISDEDQGLLVPPQDPLALAAAIRRLAGDRGLRQKLGTAGRARATNEFSLSTTVRNYEQLYRRAQSA